jgi:YD repeat-containing protein
MRDPRSLKIQARRKTNTVSQTDANNHTTTYQYDQLGRRVGRSLPAGQSESYVYDAAGNLKSKTDFNGKTTTYAYDTSNRLLSKTPDASFNANPITFTYFPNGLRQTMGDPSGATTYAYDNRNRLNIESNPVRDTLVYLRRGRRSVNSEVIEYWRSFGHVYLRPTESSGHGDGCLWRYDLFV